MLIAVVALNATVTATSATASTAAASASYAADTLLRSNRPATDASAANIRAEVARILGHATAVEDGDKSYLIGQVSAQTGLSQDDARKRVDDTVQALRETADKARKTSSVIGFFTALSMIIGAFIASVAAAYGGRQRDDHEDRVRLR